MEEKKLSELLNRSVIRFVTSWATTDENIDSFVKDFNENYKFIK